MSVKVLRSLADNISPPIIVNISTAMLAIICQAGTPDMPNLNITNTGAEKGKILKTTQTGLFGNNINRLMNHSGASANIVNMPAIPCPSRTVLLMAAIPEHNTANNK